MQIGPRIRIGGTLGHIGQELKKGAGTVAKFAAPVVSTFNPLLGAGIAAAGGALRGKSIADIVKEAAITGGTGYALGKVGGFFSGGEHAANAAGSVAPGGISSAAPATMNIDGEIFSSAPTAARSVLGRVGDAAKDVGGYVAHHPKDVAIGAGYAANAVLQNSAQNAANRINDRQVALQEREYEAQQREKAEQEARLDPVRQYLAKWLAGRMGLAGTPV